MKEAGYVIYGIYILTTLWVMLSAFAQLHLLWYARKRKRATALKPVHEWPAVTVQVPVYNEKYVVEGLLQSVAALDYPRHLLEIQVLDDSTDETTVLVDKEAKRLLAQGVCVTIVRRSERAGYKAGALQHGLSCCRGALIAIFDADFRPPADFLKRLVPHFSAPSVGMVQARWGHLNEQQNFLTRIQKLLLDMHFGVEQAGRYNAGYFTNFCGTAGVWRKQCIGDAGGWDGAVLSEDLDLSYRAQLNGWQLVYDDNLVVPAQVPPSLTALKVQQFRWTKGIAQTAHKTLRVVLETRLPLGKKLHSIFQLLASVTFVCMFVGAVLTVPLVQLRHHYPEEFVPLTNVAAIGIINLLALAFLYYQSAAKQPGGRRLFLLYYPVFVTVFLGLAVQNAVAVLQGFAGVRSPFVRTPKFAPATTKDNAYLRSTWTAVNWLETGMLMYFVYGIALSVSLKDYFMLPFFLMVCVGLAILLYPPLREVRLKLPFVRQSRGRLLWPNEA